MPGMRYNSTGHSNSLVPLFVRGVGSGLFAARIRGYDPQAAARWGVGNFVDNTDIFGVMYGVIPEPAVLSLLLACTLLLRRRA